MRRLTAKCQKTAPKPKTSSYCLLTVATALLLRHNLTTVLVVVACWVNWASYRVRYWDCNSLLPLRPLAVDRILLSFECPSPLAAIAWVYGCVRMVTQQSSFDTLVSNEALVWCPPVVSSFASTRNLTVASPVVATSIATLRLEVTCWSDCPHGSSSVSSYHSTSCCALRFPPSGDLSSAS